jgi:GTP-binding protein HflX
VAAFRATLEELNEASLLLHVLDISNPAAGQRLAVVQGMLDKLDLATKTQILVCNKADRIAGSEAELVSLDFAGLLEDFHDHAVIVSASRGWGLPELKRLILKAFYPDAG